MTLLVGDCLKTLKTLKDNSVDSVVTDPPYEIGFMGKTWDGSGIAYNVELWRECLRVLKPGGHVLAFGATRSYHRMAVAIEDAGFEIRDSIHWSYGSGFPKSLNVGKAIDKQKANRDEVLQMTTWINDAVKASGKTHAEILEHFGFNKGSGTVGHWTATNWGSQPSVPTLEQFPKLLDVLGVDVMPADIQELALRIIQTKGKPGPNWFKREVVGTKTDGSGNGSVVGLGSGGNLKVVHDVTAPATENSAKWEGWGTALKPSHEPIVVARKPLTGTVAGNVLEYGTGALNIDASRIGSTDSLNGGAYAKNSTKVPADASAFVTGVTGEEFKQPAGRWPANTLLTHNHNCKQTGTATDDVTLHGEPSDKMFHGGFSGDRDQTPKTATSPIYACTDDCPVAALEAQAPAARFFAQLNWTEQDKILYFPKPSKRERNAGCDALPVKTAGEVTNRTEGSDGLNSPRAGAGRTSGNANVHPTVKPVTLMEYLVTLVTPPGGTVLDPFLGSGTTAVAATNLGFKWVGCELTAEYVPIIKARVKHAQELRAAALAKVEPDTLF